GERLRCEHVQRRAPDAPLAQGLDQCVLVHERPPGDVDEHRVRPHEAQRGAIDHVTRERGQRRGQHHVVALPEDPGQALLSVDELHARRGIGRATPQPQHPRAEGGRPLGHRAPDPAESHDPDGALPDLPERRVRTVERAPVPRTPGLRAHGEVQPAREMEDHREDRLRDRRGVDARGVGQDDVALDQRPREPRAHPGRARVRPAEARRHLQDLLRDAEPEVHLGAFRRPQRLRGRLARAVARSLRGRRHHGNLPLRRERLPDPARHPVRHPPDRAPIREIDHQTPHAPLRSVHHWRDIRLTFGISRTSCIIVSSCRRGPITLKVPRTRPSTCSSSSSWAWKPARVTASSIRRAKSGPASPSTSMATSASARHSRSRPSSRPRRMRTIITRTVAPTASTYAPQPAAIPIAATTHSVAAVVKPTTLPRAWMIVPAPRKPIPLTICAASRAGSAVRKPAGSAIRAIAIDSSVNSAAPTQISKLVRSPAGLPLSSRSMPTMPPSTAASTRRKRKSTRKSSSGRAPSSSVCHSMSGTQSLRRRSSLSNPVLSRVRASTCLITRAGCPAATTPGGMDSVTTAPAATTLPFPTRQPSRITALAPTSTSSSITTGSALGGSSTPASTAPAPMWQSRPTTARAPTTAFMSIIVPGPM